MLASMLSLALSSALAQDDFTRFDEDGNFSTGKKENKKDSLGSNKEIPVGLKVWTVDPRFGDRIAAQPDTLSHMFMNKAFTYGMRGEYNMLGNLSSPRLNRVFVNRSADGQFIFTEPFHQYAVAHNQSQLFQLRRQDRRRRPFHSFIWRECRQTRGRWL